MPGRYGSSMSEQQSEVREGAPSPLADALIRVGDRWTLLVVQALLAGPRRFNELLDEIPGIAANILSQRLKRLEHDALLVSRPYSERPPRAALRADSGRRGTRRCTSPARPVGSPSHSPPKHLATRFAAPRSRPDGTARPVTTWWRTSPSLRCSFCSDTPHNKVSTADRTFVPFWSLVLPRVTDM